MKRDTQATIALVIACSLFSALIAARSNIRSGQDRRAPGPNMEAMRFFGPHGEHKPVERRKGDRRAIVSSFERETLFREEA